MPPDVGYADTSSDIVKPMIRMKTPRIGQDQEIEIGPPLFQPAVKLVKQPARIEMIENEIAKLENPDHERPGSWERPGSASLRSSSVIVSVDEPVARPFSRSAMPTPRTRPLLDQCLADKRHEKRHPGPRRRRKS